MQMERGPLKVILDGSGSKFRKAKPMWPLGSKQPKPKPQNRAMIEVSTLTTTTWKSTMHPHHLQAICFHLVPTCLLPASATPVNNTLNPQPSSTQPSTPGTPSTSKANQSSTSSGAPKRIPIPLPPNPRTRISLPPIPPPELHQFKGANPTHKEDGEIDDNANKTKPSSITIPTRAPLPTPRREWDKGLDSPHAPSQSLTDDNEPGQRRGSEEGRKPTTSIANSRIKTLSKDKALVRWASDIIMKELFQVCLKDLSTRIIGPTIHDFLNPATRKAKELERAQAKKKEVSQIKTGDRSSLLQEASLDSGADDAVNGKLIESPLRMKKTESGSKALDLA
ncbi:MAG: hypothetical protein J3Q66DRAFT_162354 [Benniella sp.]|nr:MAG: hypothetical protein J3Q66DRAFT_162354 [Benniella sp.]